MPRHCANAQAVAEWLQANENVAWVNYCGLEGNKYYDLAQKYLPNGSCGVIAFGLKGTREDAIRFMDNLKLACIVTHVADARTCVLHPASHTHRQLTDEQLDALEVGGLVAKKTGTAKHLYFVSYKDAENGGICLTYTAAGYGETVSYDHGDSGWTYNSTDVKTYGD